MCLPCVTTGATMAGMAEITLDFHQLDADPWPVYAHLRATAPWGWCERLGMRIVTRYDDVVLVDQQPEIFSSEVDDALTTRSWGLSMLRTEGAPHRRLRDAAGPPLKKRTIGTRWTPVLEELADRHLEPLARCTSFDAVADFAAPFTGACLRDLLGLPDATPAQIGQWSDAYIAGATNHRHDPAVWARAGAAKDEAEAHVHAALTRVRAQPDGTVVSALAHAAADEPLSDDEIASNVRLIVAGGYNDARDAVATLCWLLLAHPQTRERAAADPAVFERAIDESIRWLSPVGAFPRQLTRDITVGGVQLRKGDKLLALMSSANWDESRFPQPDRFDVDRPNLDDHLGFAAGVHYCLGTHFVRGMLRVAVPRLLALPGIQAVAEPEFRGWMFRGPRSVPLALTPTAAPAAAAR